MALNTTPRSSYALRTDRQHDWNGPFARRQRARLDAALTASTAPWKFVLAHHPLRNDGPHGNAGAYEGITCGDPLSGKHVKTSTNKWRAGRRRRLRAGGENLGRAAKPTNPALWEAYDPLGFMFLTVTAVSVRVRVEACTVDLERVSRSQQKRRH